MIALRDAIEAGDYDEFALLHENAAEWEIPFEGPPVVTRRWFRTGSGQRLSYLVWGEDPPELVFLHGVGQNAHTWDTLIMALGRPVLAADLPGHGHSDHRPDHDYGPWDNAEAVAALLESVAPDARGVVGMGLGGATTIRLAAQRPDLCRRAVLVDVTPQMHDPSRTITRSEAGPVALMAGPFVYDSFEEMVGAVVSLSPYRTAANLRRTVLLNARRLADERWTWRFDPLAPAPGTVGGPGGVLDLTPLWDDVEAITVPALLVRGGTSPFVRDGDVAEMLRRLPSLRVAVVDAASHTVQADQPLALAALIRAFLP